MSKITEHLDESQVACKCGCGFKSLSMRTAKAFEEIWNKFEVPLVISSACRCEKHNQAVGGAKNSQHVKGTALDIRTPEGIDYDNFYNACESVIGDTGGVGYYASKKFVHIDTRGHKARWRI